MKNITFLIGAGADSYYKLPLGKQFKKDTILGKNTALLFNKINEHNIYKMDDRKSLAWNSHSILYQSIVENGFTKNEKVTDKFYFNDEDYKKVEAYINYKKYDNVPNENKKEITKDFQDIYYNQFYKPIKDNKLTNHNIELFLEKSSFFSYVDSLFNYLRYSDKYAKEKIKVLRLYFSSFLSVCEPLGVTKEFIDSLTDNDIMNNRIKLLKCIENGINNLINSNNNNGKDNNNYYKIINKYINKFHIQIINTNYTEIAEKVTKVKDISYIHGKLELFENIKTKEIKRINEFNKEDVIFPYIMIQSGVKPIFSDVQIEEWHKAISALDVADYVVIIGYGINTDDEHILNILRKKCKDKVTIFMIYSDNDKYENERDRIEQVFENTIKHMYFFKSSELDNVLKQINENKKLVSTIQKNSYFIK